MELFIIGFAALVIAAHRYVRPVRAHYLGPQQITMREAVAKALERIGKLKDAGLWLKAHCIDVLSLPLPIEQVTRGVFLLGLPGMAKTICLMRILLSLAPLFLLRQMRWVITDADCTLFGFICAITPSSIPVYLLSLGDIRSVALNFTTFIRDNAGAKRLARMLAPIDDNTPDKFWSIVAQLIVKAVISVLICFQKKAKRPWTLRDILTICQRRELIREVLALTPSTRHTYRRVLHRGRAARDILAHVAAALQTWEEVAAVSELCGGELLDLKKFVRDNAVLVLAHDVTTADAFRQMCELTLEVIHEECSGKNMESDLTILGIDEAAAFRNIKSILEGCFKSRKHGIAAIVGTQSLAVMINAFGEKFTEALTSVMQTIVCFRVGARRCAEWFSGLQGKMEAWVVTHAEIHQRQIYCENKFTLQEYPAVKPEELLHLSVYDPLADYGEAFVYTSSLGVFKATGSFVAPIKELGPSPVPNQIRRDLTGVTLLPFTVDDAEALGFPLTEGLKVVLSGEEPEYDQDEEDE